MRSLIALIQRIMTYVGLFVLHLLCVNAAPFPLNHIDSIFIAAWWYVCLRGNNRGWWIVVLLGLARDIFSTSPFGSATVALFVALYAGRWLAQRVFTSHAWHIVALSSALTLTLYHALFLLILAAHHSLENQPWNSIGGGFLLVTALSVGTTIAGVMVVYMYRRLTDRSFGNYYIPR